jgi:hypothetical protein
MTDGRGQEASADDKKSNHESTQEEVYSEEEIVIRTLNP